MLNKRYLIPFNFGGLEERYSSWKNSKAVIISVPYDLTVSYRTGTRFGPRAIIDASTHMELYDEELKKETYKIGIHTLNEMDIVASSPEEMMERIRKDCLEILRAKKFPVVLGGEHSITLGVVMAFLENKVKNFSVLQFDAHADMRDEYQGTRFNHACIGKRLSELTKLAQVGIRSMSKEEEFYTRDKNIKAIFMERLIKDEIWKKEVIDFLTENVYVTIDLDVFDPSIMPSVGTPEPGGLDWYEVLEILKIVAAKKKIIGFDVVELAPISGNIGPDFLAAKLVYRLLGYIFNEAITYGAKRT